MAVSGRGMSQRMAAVMKPKQAARGEDVMYELENAWMNWSWWHYGKVIWGWGTSLQHNREQLERSGNKWI